MAEYTIEQLAGLKAAYARGVLEVREGDSWVKFQSMSDMPKAIEDIESQLKTNNAPPRGSRLISVNKGYY